jgi:type I restriction enzyme M protein
MVVVFKIFDDHERELEVLDDKYKSPIPKNLQWNRWAADSEGLKNLPAKGKQADRAAIVKAVFIDSYNYMKSGNLIRAVINKINEIDFTRSQDRHLFNDIYEKILRYLQSAGNAVR